MGFGTLIRSLSDSKRRAGNRSHGRPQRANSVLICRSDQEAVAAFYKAEQIYEAEENAIMREEMLRRNQNDKECKRQMSMLEVQKRTERGKLDLYLLRDGEASLRKYRAGWINSREFEKEKRRQRRMADEKWADFMDYYENEQRRAQRIFFSRGEEIGVHAGERLRHARVKKERNQAKIAM